MITSLMKLSRRFLPDATHRDSVESVSVLPLSVHHFDGNGNSFTRQLLSSFTYFELLPVVTTVVATSEKLALLIGANTPVASQSNKGGLTLTTGATGTNQAGIGGIANTGFSVPIRATNNVIFRTRIQLASLATMLSTAGLSTVATTIATNQIAADQVQFLADPTNSVGTGATAAQALNWILCTNVAGVTTYIFTNVPLVTGQDIELQINLLPSLLWQYSINGVVVGTSVTPATLNSALKTVVGVETLAAATAAMDIRYVQLERAAGQ